MVYIVVNLNLLFRLILNRRLHLIFPGTITKCHLLKEKFIVLNLLLHFRKQDREREKRKKDETFCLNVFTIYIFVHLLTLSDFYSIYVYCTMYVQCTLYIHWKNTRESKLCRGPIRGIRISRLAKIHTLYRDWLRYLI